MTKLINLCNTPQNKRILMEIFENGKKVAEDDVSEMNRKGLKMAEEIQEMLGRTWTYKTINLKRKRR